jgi:hypothetical protein
MVNLAFAETTPRGANVSEMNNIDVTSGGEAKGKPSIS